MSASEKTRGEFFAVLLLCLAIWLGSRGQVLLTIFCAALAPEVEPAAIVVLATVLVMTLLQNRPRWRSPRFMLEIAAGALAAAAVYFALHPDIVHTIRTAPWGVISSGTYPGGFFTTYYLIDKRHLPELALLLAAIAACCLGKKRSVLLQWPALCTLAAIIASTILHWSNTTYFALISPFLCLFILQALYAERYRHWILAAILCLTLPQYIYRFYFWQSHHAGFSQTEERRVSAAIDRIAAARNVAPQDLHIIGNYNLWFAHPSNFVNLDARTVDDTMLQHADVLLCFDQFVDPILPAAFNNEIPCSRLDNIHAMTVDELSLHGLQMQVRAPLH